MPLEGLKVAHCVDIEDRGLIARWINCLLAALNSKQRPVTNSLIRVDDTLLLFERFEVPYRVQELNLGHVFEIFFANIIKRLSGD
jgi:hypothetical protein